MLAPLVPISAFEEPFSRAFFIDCVNPLPRTKSGNQYLRTIMCTFAYFSEAKEFKYVTRFVRRGLIRAPLQNTDFTTILLIHHQTIHVYMFCGQQFTSLLFLRLLSEPCQTAVNARFVLSHLCWLFNKGHQAVRSHTTLC